MEISCFVGGKYWGQRQTLVLILALPPSSSMTLDNWLDAPDAPEPHVPQEFFLRSANSDQIPCTVVNVQ